MKQSKRVAVLGMLCMCALLIGGCIDGERAEQLSAKLNEQIPLLVESIEQGSKFLPPPYNGYAYLAGIALSIIGGIVAGTKKQKVKTDTAKTMLADVVRSVDAALIKVDSNELKTSAEIRAILRKKQSPNTWEAVKAIRHPVSVD